MEQLKKTFGNSGNNIHFLFADEDNHYLSGLAHCDQDRYLFYLLKKEGYSGVYFIKTSAKGYCVQMKDEESRECYPVHIKKFLGRENIYISCEHSTRSKKHYVAAHPNETQMVTVLHSMLWNKVRKYAFVMPLDLFYKLYRNENFTNTLKEILEQKTKHLILLTSSIYCDNDMEYLTGGNAVNRELFPELIEIMKTDSVYFGQMKWKFWNCYHVWNQMEREELRRAMLRQCEFEKNAFMKKEYRDTYADLFYLWFHSMEFRLEYPDLLPTKVERKISEVEKLLKNDKIMGQINRWLDENVKKTEIEPYRKLPGFTEVWDPEFHLQAKTEVMLQIMDHIAAGCPTEEGKRQVVKLAEEMKREIIRPWSFSGNLQKKKEFENAVVLMEKTDKVIRDEGELGSDTEDWNYFLETLKYFTSEGDRGDNPDIYNKKMELYCQVMSMTLDIVKIRRSVCRYKASIEKIKKQKSVLIEQIEEEGQKHILENLLSGKKVTAETLEMDAKNQKLIHLEEEMRLQILLYDQELGILHQHEVSRNNIITLIRKCGGVNTKGLVRVYAELERQLEEGQKEAEELEKIPKNISELLKKVH